MVPKTLRRKHLGTTGRGRPVLDSGVAERYQLQFQTGGFVGCDLWVKFLFVCEHLVVDAEDHWGYLDPEQGVGDGVVVSGQVLLAVGPRVAWFGEAGDQRFMVRADRVGRPLQ